MGSPIIDVDKLKAQESFYVKDIDANVQDMTAFSYSTFDRYTYKSKDTEKVTTGKAEADTRDYSMKVGWSFYDYNRSLNLYGLTEFVKSLPEITIDPIELQDYRIMGF